MFLLTLSTSTSSDTRTPKPGSQHWQVCDHVGTATIAECIHTGWKEKGVCV